MYKKYSSVFATKLNYIMDLRSNGSVFIGRLNAIENTTGEKDTTIKNWLFNAKIPRQSKRISIADSLGVSEEYLFDDNIDIYDIRKPELSHSEECYYVPFFDYKNIFNLTKNKIQPVGQRLPIMIPTMDELVEKYGKNIFATSISDSGFFMELGNIITAICTSHISYKEFQTIITQDEKGNPSIRRVVEDDDGLLKLQYYEANVEKLEYISDHKQYFLVLFSFSQN
jgi:hypothetical protein